MFKNISFLLIIPIMLFSLVGSIWLYLDHPKLIQHRVPLWKAKSKIIKSRLLSIPILLYHNIDGKGLYSIDSKKLRKHFQILKEYNIRVISLEELSKRLENPTPFKEKVVVLTFDDGYFSMYTKLLPLVKEFNYPVTLFVYTDFIYTRGRKVLTWERLQEMERWGIDIQSHSITHPDLTEYTSNKQINMRVLHYEEIYLAKRIIELYMKKNISFYAYPEGKYDLDIIKKTHNAGYERAVSTDAPFNIVVNNNYCLNRHHILRHYSLQKFIRLIE